MVQLRLVSRQEQLAVQLDLHCSGTASKRLRDSAIRLALGLWALCRLLAEEGMALAEGAGDRTPAWIKVGGIFSDSELQRPESECSSVGMYGSRVWLPVPSSPCS